MMVAGIDSMVCPSVEMESLVVVIDVDDTTFIFYRAYQFVELCLGSYEQDATVSLH